MMATGRRTWRGRTEKADLEQVFDVVAPKIRRAAVVASRELTRCGVRHALIGGLAVGAHGAPRATKDVDFLVDAAAFEEHADGLVTFRPGVPIAVGDVPVDLLQADNAALRDALTDATLSCEIPVVDIGALVLLKLRAMRLRDRADIQALFDAGADPKSIRKYLERFEPELLERFDHILQ